MKNLKTYIAQFPHQIATIPTEEWRTKPAPNKWSKAEIFGHLIDSANANLRRFCEIPFAEGLYVVTPYSQDDLVIINAYNEQSKEDLTQLWVAINKQIIAVVERLTPEQLQIEIELPRNEGKTTLEWLTQDYVKHLEYHKNQIVPESPVDHNDYIISTDPLLLDLDCIFGYISRSYWANKRSQETVERQLAGSLNFGVYLHGVQVGYCRAVTDYCTYAYLGDVFILEEHQGKGLGKKLIETVLADERLAGVKWFLGTWDAHELYTKYGWQPLPKPERFMVRFATND